MYRYDEFDAALVRERAEQFRGQVERRLDGSLSEEEFRPLRLMNGLYLQLHAYMLRVAVPYGTLDCAPAAPAGDDRRQVRQGLRPLHHAPEHPVQLAEADRHARHPRRAGRGRDALHPDLGNCIRNVTADHFAGVAADEIADPRPVAELIRQWSTLHPEFSFLPRKFKIAVSAARRTARRPRSTTSASASCANDAGEIGYRIMVGGGLGRTPDHRQGDPRIPAAGRSARLSRGDPAGLQSRAAGATTSTRRGSRSWSTRPAPSNSSPTSRRCSRPWTVRASTPIRRKWRGSPPISRRRRMRNCPRPRRSSTRPPPPIRRWPHSSRPT